MVDADGKNLLEAENFVAANRFTVREGAEAAFEERWAKRDSGLSKLPGFKSFTMLRRDSGMKGHSEKKGAADKFGDDFNYMSFTVWENRDAFMGWRNSQSFKDAHSSGPKKDDSAAKQPPPWTKPPSFGQRRTARSSETSDFISAQGRLLGGCLRTYGRGRSLACLGIACVVAVACCRKPRFDKVTFMTTMHNYASPSSPPPLAASASSSTTLVSTSTPHVAVNPCK